MTKLHAVEVSVHQQIKEGYRVKISVLDLGLYINGALVFPPNDKHDNWVVYPPAIPTRFKRVYPAEFDKRKTLWMEMEQAVIEAVKLHENEVAPMDYVPADLSSEEWSEHMDEELKRSDIN